MSKNDAYFIGILNIIVMNKNLLRNNTKNINIKTRKWDESSFDDFISAVNDFFLLMGFKYNSINGRSVWITRETMLKNKPHLFTFSWEYLVQSMNFSADPHTIYAIP